MIQKKEFLSNATAGVLCAMMALAYASGFATLIFGGVLAPNAGQAVLAALVSSCVAIFVLSWRSSFAFGLGGPDSNPSAILATTVAAIAAQITHQSGANAADMVPTVLMFLFLSAIGCGLVLYLVGKQHWGRYVRYIPHPVVGGFLVGTGYLLVAGGWKMLVGTSPWHTTPTEMAAVPALAWWTAGIVMFALLGLLRFTRHFLIVPGVVLGGVLVFHGVLAFQGVSIAQAHAAGLLLDPLPLSGWSQPFNLSWSLVRWDLLLAHANDFAAMTMVVLITILLNATSLDLVTGHDADFDRELKALGIVNIFAGLAGGFVATNSFNRSILNLRAGATSRWAARFCGLLVLGIAIFLPQTVTLLPKPVLTGLILYLGVSLLLAWLWDSRKEMPVADYLTMVAMLLIVAVAGIVPGVFLGVIIASMSFVVTFSRSSAVKQRFSGVTRRSSVERAPSETEWLRSQGEYLQGFILHGYLFFGTSIGVLEQIREVLESLRGVPGRARILIVDFWEVRGIDASSVMVFRKLLRLCEKAGVQTVFTGISADLRTKMANCGLDLAYNPVRLFADLDHGLEWSEQTLLSETITEVSLGEALGLLPDESEQVGVYFEHVAVSAGVNFIRKDEPSDAFYIVLKGRVSIYLTLADSDYRKRLRSYGPATIVGEMGYFSGEPRSADIRADVDTQLCRMSRATLADLQIEHPELASKLYRLVINTLANRLRAANEEIRQML